MSSHDNLKDQCQFWKARCARAEKELKRACDEVNGLKADSIKNSYELCLWRERALHAEQMLAGY